MADAIPTVAAVLTRIRRNLDEALNTNTNQWTDTDLLDWMNEGVRAVWQELRKAQQNRFVRTLVSTDAPLSIYGQSYDPAVLSFATGTATIALPPDFRELVSLTPVYDATASDLGSEFTLVPLQTIRFQAALRQTGGSDGVETLFDIEWPPSGPRLVFAPVGNVGTAVALRLSYVQDAHEFQSDESFAASGFARLDVDAIVRFAVRQAMAQPEVATLTDRQLAQGLWLEARDRALDAAAPRASAPLYVEGMLEHELEW